MIRRRQGLSNCLFPQYTSILLSSWNHQISKITSFKSRVMVLFVCNMQIMLCNQCHTWLTNLLNYYNYMLKAKDYNVLYYFLKKKTMTETAYLTKLQLLGVMVHTVLGRGWGMYDANRKRLLAYLLSGHATQYIYQPSNKNHNDNEKYQWWF